MTHKREQAIEGIHAIAREHRVACVASAVLNSALAKRSSILTERGLSLLDYEQFRANLDPTYVIRVCAAFEDCLRDFWVSKIRATEPPMVDLLHALASRLRVTGDAYVNADELREYRNELIHGRTAATHQKPLNVGESCRRATVFMRRLPYKW